jgi:hypothetical protein
MKFDNRRMEPDMVSSSAIASTVSSFRFAAGKISLAHVMRTAALALLVVSFAAATPSAFAQCPTGITNMSPASGAANVASTGTLTWSVNGGSADYFNVYFGPAGSGCSTKFLTTSYGGSSFTINYDSLAPNTQYEWKVEAVKASCGVLASSCSSFTSSPCSNSGPTLINPAIDAGMADHLKVAFAWDPVYGATGYDVMVTTNGGAATNVGSTTGQNSTLLIVDVPAGNHTWWVLAKFPGTCASASSAVWPFGTSCPTALPQLTGPAAGAQLGSASNIIFSWSGVSGADGYDVYYQRNGGTATLAGSTREGAALAGTNISATLPGAGNYSWYVVALSSGCGPLQSAAGTFTVADNCPTTAPALIAPAGNSGNVADNVVFQWSAVPNAATAGLTTYRVLVGISGATPSVVAETTDTTTTVKLPPGTHTWQVQAVFASCPTLSSGTNTFTISAPPACPTAGPTLTTPAAGAANVASPVSFAWSAVTGATAYNVYAGVNGATPAIIATVTSGTTATALLGTGTVSWYVDVLSDGCEKVSSAPSTFTITAPPTCPTAAPALSAPEAGATLVRKAGDAPLQFSWGEVPSAASYTLTILYAGTTTVVPSIEETTFSNAAFDPQSGTVEWFVTANYDGCSGVASAHRTFTVSLPPPCNLSAPILSAPVDGEKTTNQVTTFSWAPVTDVVEYRVYVLPGQSSQNPVLAGSTTDTTLTATLKFGTSSWYVEAYGGATCTRAESAHNSITINRAQTCSTDKAVLLTPANNSSGINPVQFIWKSVHGATGYQLFLSTAAGAPKPMTDVITETSATITAPEGQVQWFVKAFFPGCDPTSSDYALLSMPACTAKPAQLNTPFEAATDLTSPVAFAWTDVPGATSYDLFVGVNGKEPSGIASVTVRADSAQNTRIAISVVPGAVSWFVRAMVPNCGPIDSAVGHFTAVAPPACTTPDRPTIALQAESVSVQEYPVLWNATANTKSYELQESMAGSFANPTTKTLSSTDTKFSHDVPVDTVFYYRVRALSSCNDTTGLYSSIAQITVKGSSTTGDTNENNSNVSSGSQRVVLRTVFVPGTPGVTQTFTAFADQPWMTVTPASGSLRPEGITLTLTADPRNLQAGSNSGNIILTFSSAAPLMRGAVVLGSTSVSIPVSISLVSPVVPSGKGPAAATSLIIPAVGSTPGVNGAFYQSDIRLSNVGAEPSRYGLFFTATGLNGTRSAQQTTVTVEAGQTMALDNILKNWYGATNATGVLEIRQVATGATDAFSNVRATVASSRTFTNTPDGTYGQYIPAVPFSSFIGKGETLTLLHVAESALYHTNFGLVEAAGEPAVVHVTVYPAGGNPVSTDINLQPGEQQQINNFLTKLNIVSDNARIDLQVTSATGRVMGYASVLDNRTNDPLLVMPVQLSQLLDSDIVLPGVADLDGIAQWRTDMNVFNSASAAVNVTLTFYPSADPTQSKTIPATIAAGESKPFNDILRSSFNLTNVSGAIHITAPAGAHISASGRTYATSAKGTYGQFIPGVPHNSGIDKNSAPLQVLQLEESPLFRSNLGLVELSGKPVIVEISGITTDSKASPKGTVALNAYQFTQIGQVFKTLLSTNAAYNGRISVRVVSGDGTVAAYGSIVDNRTQDPTYVPAQQ